MNIKIVKESIIEGLQKANNIIPSKAGAAYLRSIWLKATEGRLAIMATDSNIEFTGSYPAEVVKEGVVGVQAKAFVELIRRLPGGDIKLTLSDDTTQLLIEQGKRKYRLPANDSVWFQEVAAFPEEGAVAWSGDFFQELIDRVSYCISEEENVEALGCLYMKPLMDGHLESCGLNGHQFALVSFINDDLAKLLPPEGILVQKKYLSELKKWLGSDEIDINLSDKRLYVRTGNGSETLSMPRNGNKYPDYMAFMAKIKDENASLLSLDRKECMTALERLQIFNTDSDRCTYCELHATEVLLSAQGQDVGSANETMDGVYNGSIPRIAFPTRDLVEILGHFQSAQLNMILTGAEGPCGITGGEDSGYTVIIMPMKINEKTFYDEDDK